MRAAQYLGPRQVSVAEDLTITPPQTGEVQIAVAYNGICGTDLHIFHGHMDERVSTPAVIGHEMSGTIAAVGADVDGWRNGDRVTVMPLRWDGTCPACLSGHEHICQNLDFVGIDSPGALQTHWNVDARLLVRLPDALSLEHAALVEPTAVAVHDVSRGEVARGEKVVVIGGGPIGVLIAAVARARGAEVAVIELDDGRRAAVSGLGFTALDPRADAVARVEEWTRGAGADVVFEVSGAAPAVLSAVDFARVRGRVVIVAIHTEPRQMNLQRVFWRELTIIGARVYRREDFEAAVHLLAEGSIPAGALITRIVPLDQIPEAFQALESSAAMKILVDVQATVNA